MNLLTAGAAINVGTDSIIYAYCARARRKSRGWGTARPMTPAGKKEP